MIALLHTIANDPAIVGLLAVAAADVVVGIARAIKDGMFDPHMVAMFLSTHILARVAPVAVLLVLGYASPILAPLGALAAAAYVTETVASIADHFGIDLPGTSKA